MASIPRLNALCVVLSVVSAACLIAIQAPSAQAAAVPSSSGLIALQNAATKKCVNVPGQVQSKPDAPVKQFRCDDTKMENMRWSLWRQPGTHKGGYAKYLITHEFSFERKRMCLDLPGYGKVARGTRVTTFYCHQSGDNQIFYAKKVEGGWRFVHEVTGLCLDVAGTRSKKNDEPITLWRCSSKDDHAWIVRTPRQKIVETWKSLGCGNGNNNEDVMWGPNSAYPAVRVKLMAGSRIPVVVGRGNEDAVVWALRRNSWSTVQIRPAITGARGHRVEYWWIIPGDWAGAPGVICAEGRGWKAQ